jgi:hypothetical protein
MRWRYLFQFVAVDTMPHENISCIPYNDMAVFGSVDKILASTPGDTNA